MRILKRWLKRGVQTALAGIGPERIIKGQGGCLLALMYHRILPSDHPALSYEQPGMYVTPEAFEMQMQLLSKRYSLFQLKDWVAAVQEGKEIPKLSFAITFDDGWKDNFTYAWPILKKYNIPATIFIVSDYIDTDFKFWPNQLGAILSGLKADTLTALLKSPQGKWLTELELSFSITERECLSRNDIDHIIESSKRYSESELYKYLSAMENVLNEGGEAGMVDMLSWTEVKEMQASGLVDIGSHTRKHVRMLEGLEEAQVREEVVGSKEVIAEQLGQCAPVFCYPNGNHTDFSRQLVSEHYAAAVTTQSGVNQFDTNRYLMKRIGIHQDVAFDKISFLARLTGVL